MISPAAALNEVMMPRGGSRFSASTHAAVGLAAGALALALVSGAAHASRTRDADPRAAVQVRHRASQGSQFLVAPSAVVVHNTSGQAWGPAKKPIVAGHMGSGMNGKGAAVPENTLQAILRAELDGAEMAEFDVRLTPDGHAVLIHDETVNRTTNGTGRLAEWPLDRLRGLDLGDGIRIATLDEVTQGSKLPFNVEVKWDPEKTGVLDSRELLAQRVAEARAQDPFRSERLWVVSSFNEGMLSAVRDVMDTNGLRDNVEFAFLTGGHELRLSPAYSRGFDSLHLGNDWIDAELVSRLHGFGTPVRVWTVNDPVRMRQLINFGVDGIISDEVALLRQVRDEWLASRPR